MGTFKWDPEKEPYLVYEEYRTNLPGLYGWHTEPLAAFKSDAEARVFVDLAVMQPRTKRFSSSTDTLMDASVPFTRGTRHRSVDRLA